MCGISSMLLLNACVNCSVIISVSYLSGIFSMKNIEVIWYMFVLHIYMQMGEYKMVKAIMDSFEIMQGLWGKGLEERVAQPILVFT